MDRTQDASGIPAMITQHEAARQILAAAEASPEQGLWLDDATFLPVEVLRKSVAEFVTDTPDAPMDGALLIVPPERAS